MAKSGKTFQEAAQVCVAAAFVWFAATAFASDESATCPTTSEDRILPPAVNVQVRPLPCECLDNSPLTSRIGRGFRLELGGFTRLDLIRDFDAIGDPYEFVTASIPTDGRTGSGTTVSARQTRFNLDVTHFHSSLRVFAEGDFFGPGGDFRLRHAFGEFDGVMIGQNWSTFQDESIIPNTLDYEGPVGMVFVRQPQLRLTVPWLEHVELALALEDASQGESNVDIPFSGSDDHRLPDVVGRVRCSLTSAHVQVSSILRQVSFRSEVMPDQDVLGWGIAASGAWQPREPDKFYIQAVIGDGVARYLEDLAGFSSDAALDINGNLTALPTVGAYCGWQHCWEDCLQSNLVFGFAEVANSAGQSADAFHQSEYVAGNVIWSPLPNLALGCEAMWGSRTDKSRAYGRATRVQFATTLSF